MKKILATIISLVIGASLVHAQAFLQLSSGTAFGVTTNTGPFGYPYVTNSGFNTTVSGKISSSTIDPLGYYFAFLYIPTGIGTSQDLNNLADGNWVQLAQDISGAVGPNLLGTNSPIAGNWQAQGGSGSVQVIGNNGDAFNNGTTYSLAIVGWSASMGNSWSQVEANYASGWNLGPSGFFGYEVASVNPNPAAPGNTPTAMWGNGSLVLYSPMPEPSTLALAGLGSLSLIFLRRRRS